MNKNMASSRSVTFSSDTKCHDGLSPQNAAVERMINELVVRASPTNVLATVQTVPPECVEYVYEVFAWLAESCARVKKRKVAVLPTCGPANPGMLGRAAVPRLKWVMALLETRMPEKRC